MADFAYVHTVCKCIQANSIEVHLRLLGLRFGVSGSCTVFLSSTWCDSTSREGRGKCTCNLSWPALLP